jgi:nudix-type nucleoside diphosphatase (YffH/AdpP family)
MVKREDIKLKSRRMLHEGKLSVEEIVLAAPRFSGGTMEVSREIALRPDAAAALIHDTARDVFILAEQLRIPAWLHGGAWTLELVAGKIDGDEAPQACIIREIEEEIGYRAKKVEPICSYYVSPGYTAERMHLFYAPVTARDLVKADASGVDEGEDIQRIELPRAEFLDRLDKRDFDDAKILALSGWAIKKFS